MGPPEAAPNRWRGGNGERGSEVGGKCRGKGGPLLKGGEIRSGAREARLNGYARASGAESWSHSGLAGREK